MRRLAVMVRFGVFLVCAALVLRAGPALAQTVAVTAGTTGIGGEVGFDFSESFGLRATAAYFTLSHSITPKNITYDGHAQLLTAGLLADFYPFKSGFRLSAGGLLDRNHLNLTGTPTGTVTIGSTSYTASQLGQLTGRVDFRDIAPYAGLGYTSGRGRPGWAFTGDAGVMFAGAPRVQLAATGPATALPGFATDLASERASIQNKIDWLRYYPVVKVGLLYRF